MEKISKKLFEKACVSGKRFYFCTRNSEGVHRNTGRKGESDGKKFSKKDSKKLARFENAFYICTPQNTESSLGDWEENWRKRD